ncbi:hypothetical protein [Paenibacillus solani]|uniref:Uncharacterized protein n=1 Tax=Paenibacillus solani TaxID=1705565 RepID=A0A0M1P7T4_9BACL|nr:hypothetical protein [Paenibacillus solani]KOR90365.1 hypothetical protein AM231_15365 [Paenibacillus solani]
MMELLLEFYKKKVISYQLVFRFMKIKYRLMKYSFLIFIISILPMIYGLTLGLAWEKSRTLSIGFIIFFVFMLCVLKFMDSLVNKRAKIIVKEKYSIDPNGLSWRTEKFEEKQLNLIRDYLISTSLYKEDKIKLLIEILEKDIEKRKLLPLINPGIFISLSVPIWIQYLVFKYRSIETEGEATLMLLCGTFLVLLIIILVNIIKRFSSEIKEVIFVDDNVYKKELLEKLEDILLVYKGD